MPVIKGSECNEKVAKPEIAYPIKELYEVPATIWINIEKEIDEWNIISPLYPSDQMT